MFIEVLLIDADIFLRVVESRLPITFGRISQKLLHVGELLGASLFKNTGHLAESIAVVSIHVKDVDSFEVIGTG